MVPKDLWDKTEIIIVKERLKKPPIVRGVWGASFDPEDKTIKLTTD